MANCQLTLVGSKHSSDIYMRVSVHSSWHAAHQANCMLAGCLGMLFLMSQLHISQVVRTKGPRSTLLYNLVGSANWEVLIMEASISAGGGLSRNISLADIPKPQSTKAAG